MPAEPETTTSTRPERRDASPSRSGWLYGGRGPSRRKGYAVGVTATILVHVLALFLGPKLVPIGSLLKPTSTLSFETQREPPQREFFIELAPKPPPSYIETNPNAPTNVPDQSEYYSSRDQQSATEKIVANTKDDPFVEGEKVDSQKILPGERPRPEDAPVEASEPTPIVPPGISIDPKPADRPETQPEDAARNNPSQLPEMPETTEGAGARTPEKENENGKTDPTKPGGSAGRRPLPQRDAKPADRPQLARTVLPGIVQQREGGALRSGMTAVNARFTEFGEYQARMQEAIVNQWYLLADSVQESLIFPSEAKIRFKIDQEGNIAEIEVLETTAGILGTLILRDAIEGRASYGPFTEEMRRALNKQEEFFFHFRYVY